MPSGAAAYVYIDGKLVKTVQLGIGTGYHRRRVVLSMSWAKSATRTIRIVKKYASNTMPIAAYLVFN